MSGAGEKRALEESGDASQVEEKNDPTPATSVEKEGLNSDEPAAKKTRADEAADKERAAQSITQQTVHNQLAPANQSVVHTPSFLQTGAGIWPDGMKPAVREKLEGLFVSGRCRRDEIDMKIMQSLAEFPESVGMQILSNFSDADMNSIRNKSAFLAGVMKRFRTETPLISSHAAPTMGAYGPGLGGFSSSLSADTGGMLPTVHSRLEAIFASGKVCSTCAYLRIFL